MNCEFLSIRTSASHGFLVCHMQSSIAYKLLQGVCLPHVLLCMYALNVSGVPKCTEYDL